MWNVRARCTWSRLPPGGAGRGQAQGGSGGIVVQVPHENVVVLPATRDGGRLCRRGQRERGVVGVPYQPQIRDTPPLPLLLQTPTQRLISVSVLWHDRAKWHDHTHTVRGCSRRQHSNGT